jgi:hypothetical protein
MAIHSAPTAPYQEYQEQLIRLAGPNDPIVPILHEVGNRQGWWSAATSWARTYGRHHAWQAPYAILVYETTESPQRLCVIELSKEKPSDSGNNTFLLHDAALGWLRLSPFPFDPHLPTLAKVWSIAAHGRVVRYRPYWRCTLRIEDDTGIHFVKVFRHGDGDVEALHNAGIDIWDAAMRGELDFDVAPPERWDSDMNTLWQGNLIGSPAAPELYGVSGDEMARRMGRACASIPRAQLHPANALDLPLQLKYTEDYGRVVRTRLPELAQAVDELIAKLVTLHNEILEQALRPIHGSPHPTQWLITDKGLGLVDFDRFSLGDPELDVATFMAEMDFERSTHLPVDKLNQAFVDGYETCYGPLDPARLRLYRAHKRFAKVQRTACSLRPDAPARAAQHMARVWDALAS